MEYLGFFMDNYGNVLYYGEWKEQYDKNNRHEIHTFSFEDEVESTPLFQSLNIKYNREMGLYGKAIAFALQGMVLMQNLTSNGESKFIMHAPKELTEMQKSSFTDLYTLLSSFQKQNIVIPKSIFIREEDKINDVETFYEMQKIPKEKIRRR